MSIQELNGIVELLTSRPQPENPSPAEMREGFEKLGAFMPLPDDGIVTPVDAGGVACEWVAAPGVSETRVLLYLHGGGYVIGSLNTHRRLAYDMSKAANARVLNVDYRMAPEAPYPAAVEDAVTAYKWLLDQGTAAGSISISGDSAGGGLTMACLLSLKAQGIALPACAVPLSPWVDLEGIGGTMTSLAEADPMVRKEGLDRMSALYRNGADVRDPLVSPMYGDMTGLPPLLIQVGTRETLLDDARRLHQKALADGVVSSLEEAGGMIHVFHLFGPMLSEARDAIGRAGAFMQIHAKG